MNSGRIIKAVINIQEKDQEFVYVNVNAPFLGSIGKAYGYQLGVKHHYPEGDMDQVDKVLWDLKHTPPPAGS